MSEHNEHHKSLSIRGGQNKPKTENQTEPNGYRFFGFGFSVIGFGFGFHLVLISVIGSVSVSLKKLSVNRKNRKNQYV